MFSKQFNKYKSNNLFHCTGSNLDIYGSVQFWLKEQFFYEKKRYPFLKKRIPEFYPCPYSIPILSVLHENKALHNFRQGGQHLIVEFNVGLEYALFVVSGKLAVNGLTSSWYIAHPEFLQNFNYPRLALLIKKFYTFFRTASWS